MAKEKSTDDELDDAREDDGQIYVERDKIDFDPDEGLLSGTAIDGTSDIPGSEGEDGNGDDSRSEAKSSEAESSETESSEAASSEA